MTSPVLLMTNVSRAHRRGRIEIEAIRNINLTVDAGELVAIMGPSGSGKSTLLDLAGGLYPPGSGQVAVCGSHLASLSATRLAGLRRSTIGYVFQELNLLDSLTAAENVALPLELDGMKAVDARRLAHIALELVGMDHAADQFPESLSGGEQQRVAIARAFVGSRKLVLADEPTGALDSITGEKILDLLRERCDAGTAAVLVTHEPRYAAWADRVVYLRDGAIVGRDIANPSIAAMSPSAGK